MIDNANGNVLDDAIYNAIDAIKNNKMVLLFDSDDREGETDFVIPAISTTPQDVAIMRKDGGGLICVAIHPVACEQLGLPFISDVLSSGGYSNITEKGGDIRYDRRSSFSLWVNHRDTFTGIPDDDRSYTIRKLGEIVKQSMNGEDVDFADGFRTPGHVALLRGAEGLIDDRQGQTELSLVMAEMAGVTSAMVVCEMLDENSGKALTKDDAMEYAKEHDLVFVTGAQVVDAYDKWKKKA